MLWLLEFTFCRVLEKNWKRERPTRPKKSAFHSSRPSLVCHDDFMLLTPSIAWGYFTEFLVINGLLKHLYLAFLLFLMPQNQAFNEISLRKQM